MAPFTFGKINVLVRDLDSAVEYVRGVLGGELVRAATLASLGDTAIVSVSGLTMELIQPVAGSALALTMEKRGEGINSVGFLSDDVRGVASELKSRGARMLEPGGPDMEGTAWVHPKNPLSLSIEFYTPQTETR